MASLYENATGISPEVAQLIGQQAIPATPEEQYSPMARLAYGAATAFPRAIEGLKESTDLLLGGQPVEQPPLPTMPQGKTWVRKQLVLLEKVCFHSECS
jgi:hypothetical protein